MHPIFARITKVDEQTRTVTGRAAQEVVDRDNELFDYATSKPEFMKWSAEVSADTDGKSLGNVRSMHGNVAAGKLTDIDFNDVEKAIDVSAKIVDDNEWKKCLEGVHTGFSIGGRYAKKWAEPINGRMVTRYTAVPSEISIVDRPCIPTAKFFSIHKRDGSIVEKAFVTSQFSLDADGTVSLAKVKTKKTFAPATAADSGLQDYDLEGEGRKPQPKDARVRVAHKGKKKVKAPQSPKPKKPSNAQAADSQDAEDSQPADGTDDNVEEWDCEDENGGTVSCDDEDNDDDNDGASQDGSQDDELSAKRSGIRARHGNPARKASPRMTEREQDANADDAFDTDPNDTQTYGKRKFSSAARDSAAESGAAMPDGSFPIKNKKDLKNAILAHGRAKDPEKAKAHIKGRAKALGATDALPDDWKKVYTGELVKRFPVLALDHEGLEKFYASHARDIAQSDLVKGIYDVASLGNVISQLHGITHAAFVERKIEGDASTVPEELRDAAANLLSVLSDMAAEESEEIEDGTTAEDVLRDRFAGSVMNQLPCPPSISAGLYCADVGGLAKALRTSLFGEDVLEKKGARNSKKDLELLQKAHDALCELGASCGSPHDSDGDSVQPNVGVEKMAQVQKKDTISAEGDKRGAAVSDPSPGQNSANATTDEDKTLADDGASTAQKGKSKGKIPPQFMAQKKKARKDEDDDMDDDDDEDEDECHDDEEDEEEMPPPKAKKKAKKSFDANDLAKAVAAGIAAAMPQMLEVMQKSAKGGEIEVVIPKAAPNLMQVGKEGVVNKLDATTLKKSVTPVNAGKVDAGDDDTATLIKAIHADPAFRIRDVPFQR